MLYTVWTNFQTADTNANDEANSLVNLSRAADGLPKQQRDAIEIAAAAYAGLVVNREWPHMHEGIEPHAGHPAIVRLWTIVTQTPVETALQQTSLSQAMTELSNMTKHRRIRILESRTQMPNILWAVLVMGGMITIAACCLIGSENVPLHLSLVVAISLLISLALVAIADIDRPYQGSVCVTPQAMIEAQQSILSPASAPHD